MRTHCSRVLLVPIALGLTVACPPRRTRVESGAQDSTSARIATGAREFANDNWLDIVVPGVDAQAAEDCEGAVARELQRWPPEHARLERSCATTPLPTKRESGVLLVHELPSPVELDGTPSTAARFTSYARFDGSESCRAALAALRTQLETQRAEADAHASEWLQQRLAEQKRRAVEACEEAERESSCDAADPLCTVSRETAARKCENETQLAVALEKTHANPPDPEPVADLRCDGPR